MSRPLLRVLGLAGLIGLAAAAVYAQPSRRSVPPPPPSSYLDLMGHYGSGLTELVVYEDNGLIAAWTEGRPLRLSRIDARTFSVAGGPPWVNGQTLRFTPDSGRAAILYAGRYVLGRRPRGPVDGDVFRIQPLRPVDEVLREARTARSPHGPGARRPDLVDLRHWVPNVLLDVRYATPRNFMGTTLYPAPRAILQRPAALALAAAQRDLARYGLGIVVYDGYRPWYVTKAFWDATPPEQRGFVANPRDGSKHNRGCAVDIGLYALQTGERIEMPSDYDEFSPRAYADYVGGTTRARHYRDLLAEVMGRHGFAVNPTEWWHFDYRDWRSYGVLNIPFESIR